MRTLFSISFFFLFSFWGLYAQKLQPEVFNLLDLNQKGLEKVKKYHSEGNDVKAAAELLDYYRNRTTVNHPDVNLKKVKIGKKHQQWADDALKHRFFVHKGYQPSYFYGDDINWQYWPVKDNELRWQLHRHKWWTPMGKAYRVSGDEKYAKEWILQYLDWIKKNPLVKYTKEERKSLNKKQLNELKNMRFAWRPLEVSHRLQDQTIQFAYFVDSKYFTPEFLTQFLVNYEKHANHVLHHYTKKGNHLLFEAQRMIYAGGFFSEFKDAEKWRKSGIEILNKEIKKQVYDDGFQFELDPHYHLAAINIFYKALRMADANDFRDEFPPSYLNTVEKMIMATINYSFPDYHNPCFSDAKLNKKSEMIKYYKAWSKIFPKNKQIKYMATEGKKGALPNYLSNRLATSGFYIFRNGWKKDATVMVLKAGPPAFWHNQPDNGTFELYVKGRNFFPDAGSYVYGGNSKVLKQRNWFRQTMVHKTLTLDNKNLEETNTKCLLWDIDDIDMQKLVIENPSYFDLNHRRTVFFVEQRFFVIVDEAIGKALGDVAIHYQLGEGDVDINQNDLEVTTLYDDENNVLVKGFGQNVQFVEEEGWVSYAYRHKKKRPAFAFQTLKETEKPTRFITVIYPFEDEKPTVSAIFEDNEDAKVNVKLKVDKKEYELRANWK